VPRDESRPVAKTAGGLLALGHHLDSVESLREHVGQVVGDDAGTGGGIGQLHGEPVAQVCAALQKVIAIRFTSETHHERRGAGREDMKPWRSRWKGGQGKFSIARQCTDAGGARVRRSVGDARFRDGEVAGELPAGWQCAGRDDERGRGPVQGVARKEHWRREDQVVRAARNQHLHDVETGAIQGIPRQREIRGGVDLLSRDQVADLGRRRRSGEEEIRGASANAIVCGADRERVGGKSGRWVSRVQGVLGVELLIELPIPAREARNQRPRRCDAWRRRFDRGVGHRKISGCENEGVESESVGGQCRRGGTDGLLAALGLDDAVIPGVGGVGA